MFDIEGFVSRWISDDYRIANDELQVNCAYCDDSKNHMYINLERNVYHCFKCGRGGTIIGLAIDVTKYPLHRAIGELYKVPSMVEFHKMGKPARKIHTVGLPEDFENLLYSDAPEAKLMRSYLSNRGITSWHISRYNLGLSPKVENRIIIPVEEDYWQARRLYEWMEPKYKNPELDARKYLFNSSALSSYDEVVVCEGCFSAISVGANAIALLGKEAPIEKVRRIADSMAKRIIIALDSDANKHALALASMLYKLCDKEVTMWTYANGDPAENDGNITVSDMTLKEMVRKELGL